MKNIKILHNPNAGDGAHSKNEIISLLKPSEFSVSYASLKEKGWDKFHEEEDILVVAGGDGAIGKVVKNLLKRPLGKSNHVLAILPLGTSNNFAKSLGIQKDYSSFVNSLFKSTTQRIDIGRILTAPGQNFFLESTGIGLISLLMKDVEKLSKENKKALDKAEDKRAIILNQLYKLVLSAEAIACRITLDKKNYVGNYLLAEIMNISTIGPNLCLAPNAHATDGLLNVVLISEDERQAFASFICRLSEGKEASYSFKTFTAKEVNLECENTLAHADDKLFPGKGIKELKASLNPGLIQFILPK